MRKHLKVIVVVMVTLVSVGCDQVTKFVVRGERHASSPKTFLGGFVRLQYAENTGAFLGVGSDLPSTLRAVIIGVIALAALTGFIALVISARRMELMRAIAFSLVLGGAFGNLIDRIFNGGKVIDFLVVGFGSVRTGIFNVADVLIDLGALALVFAMVSRKKVPVEASASEPTRGRTNEEHHLP